MAIPLPDAFELYTAPELVAVVGAGGKTSLLFTLAKSLPGRVVITTTTHLAVSQLAFAPSVCRLSELDLLSQKLDQYRVCLLVGRTLPDGRVAGVDPQLPGRLLARADVDFVLVEADGARMKPIKAPAAHEPAIPPSATLVVPVVGIDALRGKLDEVAHRPELVRRLLGKEGRQGKQLIVNNQQLMVNDIAGVLAHPQGGLKDVPAGARVVPFINKVETESQLQVARKIGVQLLQEPRIERVVIGAAQAAQPVAEVHKRVTAVLLAAGSAKRMGQTKQLLPWGETTVLGQSIENAKRAALHDIVVVSGHDAPQVAAIAAAEGVSTVHNPDYAAGEMLSSLQTAVSQLDENVTAVLVMLADQPMLPPDVLDLILYAYWQGKGALIAPTYQGQRGNPVLIGRCHFDELLTLPVGAAPRDLLHRHKDVLYLLPVSSETIRQDLDHMTDYLHWRP